MTALWVRGFNLPMSVLFHFAFLAVSYSMVSALLPRSEAFQVVDYWRWAYGASACCGSLLPILFLWGTNLYRLSLDLESWKNNILRLLLFSYRTGVSTNMCILYYGCVRIFAGTKTNPFPGLFSSFPLSWSDSTLSTSPGTPRFAICQHNFLSFQRVSVSGL